MTRPRFLLAAFAALLVSLPLAAPADTVIKLTPKDEQPVDIGSDHTGLLPTTPDDTGNTRSIASTGDGSHSYDAAQMQEVDAPPVLQTRHFGGQVALACAPSQQRGALVVTNEGQDPLPAGTRIKWQFPQSRERGYFALVGALPAGATLVADDVLDKAANAAGECSARVI